MNDRLRAILIGLGKTIATAFILTLLVFFVIRIAAPTFPLASFLLHVAVGNFGHSATLSEPVGRAIVQRLPSTLELIIVSYVISLGVAFGLVRLAARFSERIVAGVAMALRAVPFFWLVSASVFVMAVHFQVSIPPPMLLVACVLAIFQLPAILDFLSNRFGASDDRPITLNALLRCLAVLFAKTFPEIFGAAVIAEIYFVQPGEGRLFWTGWDDPLRVGFVLLSAFFVLAVRFLVETFLADDLTDGATSDV
ncbi:MAG TPA: hypothetical protein VMS32_01885 [Verrucomicrobiae bacterium]|nr:hypothetical protein [Verrucomicrobiae bacterium]